MKVAASPISKRVAYWRAVGPGDKTPPGAQRAAAGIPKTQSVGGSYAFSMFV